MTEEKLRETAQIILNDDYLSGWLKENDEIIYHLTKELNQDD